MFLGLFGVAERSTNGGGLAVWDAVGASGHEMSLFPPSGSFYLTGYDHFFFNQVLGYI